MPMRLRIRLLKLLAKQQTLQATLLLPQAMPLLLPVKP